MTAKQPTHTKAGRKQSASGKPSTAAARYREPAPQDMDPEAFERVVRSRRSVKRFTDAPIPPEVLDACLDLALLAPNSSNLQPWAFYKVQSPNKKHALVRACLDQNAAKTAAELIVVVARTDTYLENAKRNLSAWPDGNPPKIVRDYYSKLVPLMYSRGPLGTLGVAKGVVTQAVGQFRPMIRGPFSAAELKVWAVKSTALAAENLMLALRAYGYDSCPMEGFDEARVARLLRLPQGASIPMVIGAGVRADEGVYHPQIRFERSRFVFTV